jgi:hypothetical protein
MVEHFVRDAAGKSSRRCGFRDVEERVVPIGDCTGKHNVKPKPFTPQRRSEDS